VIEKVDQFSGETTAASQFQICGLEMVFTARRNGQASTTSCTCRSLTDVHLLVPQVPRSRTFTDGPLRGVPICAAGHGRTDQGDPKPLVSVERRGSRKAVMPEKERRTASRLVVEGVAVVLILMGLGLEAT
jgi:hypothetical protein